jgi:amino acid transporter
MVDTIGLKAPSDDESLLDEEAQLTSDQAKEDESLPRVSVSLTIDDLDPIPDHDEPKLPKQLTYWNGSALIITRSIGSGIFSMVALVNGNSGSMGMSLLIWIFTGCVAYCGACPLYPRRKLMVVSYAELGTAIPFNGGAYTYLARVYGPLAGCLFSWVTIFILKPMGAAIGCLICGEYITRVLSLSLEQNATTPVWAHKLAGLACIWGIVAINILGSRIFATVNGAFMVMKVGALACIAIIGMAVFCMLLLGSGLTRDSVRSWTANDESELVCQV